MSNSPRQQSLAGFTLVEVIIGMTLSLLVMGAVLSGYVYLGRNFTRSLGLISVNEPSLENQGRRTLAYFSRDVRMASQINLVDAAPKVVPNNFGVTLEIPAPGDTDYVTYYYNSSESEEALGVYAIPARTLVRIDHKAGSMQIMHTHLLSFHLRYFDIANRPYDNGAEPYTTATTYLSGIKQISFALSSRGGKRENGTQTPIYSTASSQLTLRNRQLPP